MMTTAPVSRPWLLLFGLLLAMTLTTTSQAQNTADSDSAQDEPFASEMGDPAKARVPAEMDPWEPYNRRVFAFNEFFDRSLLLPVARGYRTVAPPAVNAGVSNFFSNLGELGNVFNSLLQGKGEGALISTGRFVFNSTFGILGIFDVASHFELPRQNEDFGQTLGYWGVNSGPYLVLPFLGPSTPRDSVGLGVDYFSPGPADAIPRPDYYYLRGVQVVDMRAGLIPAERSITGDRYTFLRNAYLQRREYLVRDGRIESDPFADGDDDDLMLDDF